MSESRRQITRRGFTVSLVAATVGARLGCQPPAVTYPVPRNWKSFQEQPIAYGDWVTAEPLLHSLREIAAARDARRE